MVLPQPPSSGLDIRAEEEPEIVLVSTLWQMPPQETLASPYAGPRLSSVHAKKFHAG